MRLWKHIRHYVVPTQENVYRPHLLGKTALLFFFMLTLAVEGFLVAGLMARESDGRYLSGIGAQSAAVDNSSGATSLAQPLVQSVGRETLSTLQEPESLNWILGSIVGVLALLVALAFFVHLDVHAHEMVLGGVVVAAVALMCLVANRHFLTGQNAQTAAVGGAGDKALVSP